MFVLAPDLDGLNRRNEPEQIHYVCNHYEPMVVRRCLPTTANLSRKFALASCFELQKLYQISSWPDFVRNDVTAVRSSISGPFRFENVNYHVHSDEMMTIVISTSNKTDLFTWNRSPPGGCHILGSQDQINTSYFVSVTLMSQFGWHFNPKQLALHSRKKVSRT